MVDFESPLYRHEYLYSLLTDICPDIVAFFYNYQGPSKQATLNAPNIVNESRHPSLRRLSVTTIASAPFSALTCTRIKIYLDSEHCSQNPGILMAESQLSKEGSLREGMEDPVFVVIDVIDAADSG